MRTSLLLAIIIFTSFTVVGNVKAATKSLTVAHTYLIGDNDSRNDARRLCLLEAKRKLLEEAGTYIEASSEVKNLELTKDQITSYSAAILRFETVQESMDFKNGQNALTLTVKADIDTDEVNKRLATLASDRALQKQVEEQQKQLRQHEEAIKRLNAKLAVATPDQTKGLLEERNVVFADMDQINSIHTAAKQRIQKTLLRDCEIAQKMNMFVLKGMNQKEVLAILGEPYKKGSGSDNSWYYGESSLEFDDPRGIAAKLIESHESISKLRESTVGVSYNDPKTEEQRAKSEQSLKNVLALTYQVRAIHIGDSCM
jgi:outer membrane protein assembly factor BamE (lipoprotein component of BamABCDE complex)